MIGNITNFSIYSHTRNESTTDLTFVFDRPTGNHGAYVLYRGYNSNIYDEVKTRVDIAHTGENPNETTDDLLTVLSNNKIYFNYTIPAEDDGRPLYFKMKAVSKYKESSAFSDTITFNNYATSAATLLASYDNFEVKLSWDNISFDSNKNTKFKSFSAFRKGVTESTDFTINENILYGDDFLDGKAVWVKDVFTRSNWFGLVTSSGTFTLSDDTKITQYKRDTSVVQSVLIDGLVKLSIAVENSYLVDEVTCLIGGNYKNVKENINAGSTDLYLEDTTDISVGDTVSISSVEYRNMDASAESLLNLRNIKVYIESDSEEYIGNSLTNTFTDTSFEKNRYYIYKVYTTNIDDYLSYPSYFPVYTISALNVVPILRGPDNSKTDVIKQEYWRNAKNALIDKNYYLKEKFDIPFLLNRQTNFKGYLGVSLCNVDVWINDILTFTVTSDEYGEFDINYSFPKGQSKLQIQARDKNNIDFSQKSSPYLINTVNTYTSFAILGTEISEYAEELELIKSDNNIATARYSTFLEKYAPYIEIYKSSIETDEDFLDIAATVYEAYETAGYDKSLNDVLNKFVEKVPQIDHFEIYQRYSLFDSIQTGKAFIPNTPLLGRSNIYYGVTATNLTGEETSPSIIRSDSRWWPFNYKGYNVLVWDTVPNAYYYNVYKGDSEDSLEYMLTIPNNVFVDNGVIIPNENITPPTINYSGIQIPGNAKPYLATRISQLLMLYKKLANTVIILFAKDDEQIPEIHLTRLEQLFYKLIPPEVRYTLLYVRDSEIYIYPDDVYIRPDSGLVYALYDHTNYDSGEVYY